MERFAHLIKKIYEQAQNGVTVNTIYKDVLELQQEMQKVIVTEIPNCSNLVAVQLPSTYTPNHNFSNNSLKNEVLPELAVPVVNEPERDLIEQTTIQKESHQLLLVDESDDDDEIGYSFNFNKKSEITEIVSVNNEAVTLTTEQIIEETETAVIAFEPKQNNLSKLISLSDRYLFISELFKGEESNFERSLKAIQNFETLKDASFWIERELITKQGWRKDDETVEHFMDLVNRRFA